MTREAVLAAMKKGAKLHMQYDNDGASVYWLSTKKVVDNDTVVRMIDRGDIIGLGDALFDFTQPQTFGLVQ